MKKLLLSVILLCFCAISFSQNLINISYEETINLGKVNEKTQFYISSNKGKVNLKGGEINFYKFEKPGNYKIKIVEHKQRETATCEAHLFPEEITVKVSSVKMIFDSTNLAFSEPIRKNISTENIVMSIPVTISTYDHKSVKLGNDPVNSAGIGTSIVARPMLQTNILREGTHILRYALTGLVNINSYLMFDFIDANNQVQTVSLPTPVKN